MPTLDLTPATAPKVPQLKAAALLAARIADDVAHQLDEARDDPRLSFDEVDLIVDLINRGCIADEIVREVSRYRDNTYHLRKGTQP